MYKPVRTIISINLCMFITGGKIILLPITNILAITSKAAQESDEGTCL